MLESHDTSDWRTQTTSITYCVTTLIPTPKGSDGGPTILASYDHGGVLVLQCQLCNINWRGSIGRLVALRLRCGCLLFVLGSGEVGTLRYSVVESRASTTPIGSSSAITFPTAWTRATRGLIRRYICSSRCSMVCRNTS